MSRKDRF